MRYRKCQQLGHAEIICKEKEIQRQGDAQVANQEGAEQLFAASCFASGVASHSWLIDSDGTSHMTNDEKLFRELNRSAKSRGQN